MSETAEPSPSRLVEYAHERLREAILTAELKPADTFSQVRLAREFGISRTPLREAVRLLEYEGLAEVQYNKRVAVSALSAEDLDSLYATRITMECLALHDRVPWLGEPELDESERLLLEMEEAVRGRDFMVWSASHRRFHLNLVQGASQRTDQQIAHLYDHAQRYRRVYLQDSEAHWRQSQCDHREIHDACVRGDRAGATRLLSEHYARTAYGVLAVLAPDHSPSLTSTAIIMVKGLVFAS